MSLARRLDRLFVRGNEFTEQNAPGPQRGGRIRMTDIDPQADLEVHFVGEHMTVRLPLA